MKRLQNIIGSGLLFFLSFGLVPPGIAQNEAPIPVGVARVVERSVKSAIQLSGTVLPWATSRLAAEIDGRVEELHFREGQFVTKNAPLVQLRTEPIELKLALMRAERKRVATRLNELFVGSRKETIKAAQAALSQAKAELKLEEINLQRQKKLFEQGVVSLNDYDQARALEAQARAFSEGKKAYLDEVITGPRIETIQQEKANLKSAEERIRIIEDQIDRASIYAPFNGYIVKKETEVGQWLEKGDPALTLIAVNPLKVEVALPQYYFDDIREGNSAIVKLKPRHNPQEEKVFNGTIIEKIVSGDPASRTFPVRVKIKNAHKSLAPGMLVSVEIHPKGPSISNLFVPKDAVVRTPRETLVWIARKKGDGFKTEKILVETGRSEKNRVAITPLKGKIEKGNWVIVQGNERLRPNSLVTIRKKFEN